MSTFALGFLRSASGEASDQVLPLSSEYIAKILPTRVLNTIISCPLPSSTNAFSMSHEPFMERLPYAFHVAPLSSEISTPALCLPANRLQALPVLARSALSRQKGITNSPLESSIALFAVTFGMPSSASSE
eukprot:CAMPEP_0177758046 /NCGR_PEP_ID=MMETSP0491_2-20121128/3978_1 /TAXON_ID=63592 /ORGANISM="Tetraselmis chuii, Strain PLY429" /LENGTH=130 /DNA_ID=CAMNT_0019273759 /DNA_START=507 /DNA_END=899 /DNA_ORIENTATION=+